eukprot:425353-Rhodomonas_salina.1
MEALGLTRGRDPPASITTVDSRVPCFAAPFVPGFSLTLVPRCCCTGKGGVGQRTRQIVEDFKTLRKLLGQCRGFEPQSHVARHVMPFLMC